MPFEGKQGVIPIHSAAVIDHPNARHSATLNPDLDRARTSINAILDQFLHDRGRPLHHFARGHLAGESFGKKFDPAHWTSDLRSIRLASLAQDKFSLSDCEEFGSQAIRDTFRPDKARRLLIDLRGVDRTFLSVND